MNEWTSEEILEFRRAFKLTRKALGELVGVTITSIYQWERGERRPSKTAKLLLSRIEDDFKQRKERR